MIKISHAPQLKHLFGEWDQQNHSSHQWQNVRPNLKHISLVNLENLIGLCLEDNRLKLPSLSEPTVTNCPKLSASWIAMMIGSEEKEVCSTLFDMQNLF